MEKDPYYQKKRKKIVLDEEKYLSALESLIERDYFPDSARYHSEYPSSSRSPPSPSPSPLSERDEINIKTISINQFFHYYTSEDNESFEIIQENDLKERRKRLHWMYETSGINPGMLMLYHQGGQTLSIEDREKIDKLLECPTTIGDDRLNGVDTWRFRVRNQLMFPPELEASRDTCYLPSTDPSANARFSIEASREMLSLTDKEPNSLALVIHDGQHLSHIPRITGPRELSLPEKVIEEDSKKSRESTKLMPPPSIIPTNTRLNHYQEQMTPYIPSSASPLERPHTPSVLSEDGFGSKEYRAVAMTPTPMNFSSSEFSPLMTWGDISGTPILIKLKSIPRTETMIPARQHIPLDISPYSDSFRIPELSNREKLAHNLLDIQSKKIMKKEPIPKSTPSGNKTGNLSKMMKTPLTAAGIALAEKFSSSKSILRSSYQPSQSQSSANSIRRSEKNHEIDTPRRNNRNIQSTQTNDLLQF